MKKTAKKMAPVKVDETVCMTVALESVVNSLDSEDLDDNARKRVLIAAIYLLGLEDGLIV